MNTTTLTRDELMAFIAGSTVDNWELGIEMFLSPDDITGAPILRHVIREFKS